MQPCGRKLRCGNHLCPSPCHAGPCQPCPLSATIACACGRTTYSMPCGTESSAKPPKCSEVRTHAACSGVSALPLHACGCRKLSFQRVAKSTLGCVSFHNVCVQDCPIPRTCMHAKDLSPHPCHFGPCPSCTQPCGTVQVSFFFLSPAVSPSQCW